MHSRGRPETMQRKPFTRDIWRSLTNGLETSIRRALAAGVKRSQLILDPGLGFGKSRRQNYQILAGLAKLQRFHLPLLIGASRKSFVQAIVAGEGLEPSRSSRPGARYWPIARRVAMNVTAAANRATGLRALSQRVTPPPWLPQSWVARISCAFTTPQQSFPPCALPTPCSRHSVSVPAPLSARDAGRVSFGYAPGAMFANSASSPSVVFLVWATPAALAGPLPQGGGNRRPSASHPHFR